MSVSVRILNSLTGENISAFHGYSIPQNKGKEFDAHPKGYRWIPCKESGLARSVVFTPLGDPVVCFNKKTPRAETHKAEKRDFCLSRTKNKVVTIAKNLSTGQLYASSSMSSKEVKAEHAGMESLKGMEEVAPYEFFVGYISSKTGKKKFRAFRPLESRGDLVAALPKLTQEEKLILSRKLISFMCAMHKRGVLHCDIKSKNFLVKGKGKDITILAIDLAAVTQDKTPRFGFAGTPKYMPPDIALKIIELEKSRKKGGAYPDPTEGCDVWALGRVLAELFNLKGKELKGPVIRWSDGTGVITQNYEEAPEPLDVSSLEHVIWRMLRRNPGQRITSKELSELPGSIYDSLVGEISEWEAFFQSEFGEKGLSSIKAGAAEGFSKFPDDDMLNLNNFLR